MCSGAVMAVRMSVDWDFSAFVIPKLILCGPPGGGQSIFFFSKSKSLDLCFNMKDDHCQSMTGWSLSVYDRMVIWLAHLSSVYISSLSAMVTDQDKREQISLCFTLIF